MDQPLEAGEGGDNPPRVVTLHPASPKTRWDARSQEVAVGQRKRWHFLFGLTVKLMGSPGSFMGEQL